MCRLSAVGVGTEGEIRTNYHGRDKAECTPVAGGWNRAAPSGAEERTAPRNRGGAAQLEAV